MVDIFSNRSVSRRGNSNTRRNSSSRDGAEMGFECVALVKLDVEGTNAMVRSGGTTSVESCTWFVCAIVGDVASVTVIGVERLAETFEGDTVVVSIGIPMLLSIKLFLCECGVGCSPNSGVVGVMLKPTWTAGSEAAAMTGVFINLAMLSIFCRTVRYVCHGRLSCKGADSTRNVEYNSSAFSKEGFIS